MAVLAVKPGLLSCILVFLSVILITTPFTTASTEAWPYTNDHSTTISVDRWFYTGVTPSELAALLGEHEARITKLRVDDPDIPTFSATLIKSAGSVYGVAWWWFYGLTASQLESELGNLGARIISLDPYHDGGGTLRFAAVMVDNVDKWNRAWWWYYGLTTGEVDTKLSENNARPVDIRRYSSGGEDVIALVMIRNEGRDFKDWEYWMGVSPQYISDRVDAINGRIEVLSPWDVDSNTWIAAIMASEGEKWWWNYGISASQVVTSMDSHASRAYELQSYVPSNGQRRYATVEIDNSNLLQDPINSRSSEIWGLVEAGGWGSGIHGVYFAESAGSLNPIVAYNSRFRYEPASAMKVLYLWYALRTGVNLEDDIIYYWTDAGTPSPNDCPLNVAETPENQRTTTVRNAAEQMMRVSNNIYTRAFAIAYGAETVQNAARDLLASDDISLGQPDAGCGFRGGVRNELTLEDTSRLYSMVDRGTAGLSATATQDFYDIMFVNTFGPSHTQQVLREIAAEEGIDEDTWRDFGAAMQWVSKGGLYGICLDFDCMPYKMDTGINGWISIASDNGASSKSYVFGSWVNDLVLDCDACPSQSNALDMASIAVAEAMRETLRDALLTWV